MNKNNSVVVISVILWGNHGGIKETMVKFTVKKYRT